VTPDQELAVAIRDHREHTLAELIPEDHSKTFEWIDAAATRISHNDKENDVLVPVLGNLMSLTARNPDLLKVGGYSKLGDLEEYIKKKYRISHGRLWKYKSVSEKIPSLTVKQYSEIGIEKLYLVGQHSLPNSIEQDRLLAMAEHMTASELKSEIVSKGKATPGEMASDSITIEGNRDQIDEILAFLSSTGIHQHVGTDRPAEIILAMIGECRGSGWEG